MRIDLEVRPAPDRYFPPVELRDEDFALGIRRSALAASRAARSASAADARRSPAPPAYHDHNWGVWRDVTWEWGAAQGRRASILYGGVYSRDSTGSPFFLALLDSLGVRQILRFDAIRYRGTQPAAGLSHALAPQAFA